jgi:hypothetical protein
MPRAHLALLLALAGNILQGAAAATAAGELLVCVQVQYGVKQLLH